MRARLAAAVAVGGLVAAPSYATQRLIDAVNEPPLGTVLEQATIPYYWRVGIAVLHGLIAATIVWFLAHDDDRARGILARLPWITWIAGAAAAAAVGLNP